MAVMLQDVEDRALLVRDDTKLALDSLAAVRDRYTEFLDYFEGRQPGRFSSIAMERLWQMRPNPGSYDHVENTIAPAVYYVNNGISIRRFEVDDTDAAGNKSPVAEQLEANLNDWVRRDGAGLELKSAMLYALVFPESYIIAWPDADGNEVEAAYEDPRQVRLFYREDRPREKRFGCKLRSGTVDGRSGEVLTLYYPDRLVTLFREVRKNSIGILSNRKAEQFELVGEVANPYGIVPVFEFRARHPVGRSMVEGLIPAQNRINKYVVGKSLSVDYGIHPLLFLMTKQEVKNGDVRRGPNQFNLLEPGDDVKIIDPSDPTIFDRLKDAEVESIRRNEQLPRSFTQATGADLSGEAQRVAEAPLVRRREDIIENFEPTIADLLAFRWQVLGVAAPYTHAEFDSPASNIRSLEIAEFTALTSAGVNVRTALRKVMGWEDADLDTMADDEAAEGPDITALARTFNAGGALPVPPRPRTVSRRVERDGEGRIARVIEEEQ